MAADVISEGCIDFPLPEELFRIDIGEEEEPVEFPSEESLSSKSTSISTVSYDPSKTSIVQLPFNDEKVRFKLEDASQCSCSLCKQLKNI